MSETGPDGPWTNVALVSPPANGVFPFDVANPTPYIFPNGSVLMLYRSYSNLRTGGTWQWGAPYPGYTMIGVATAPHWRGPYTLHPTPIFDNLNEDPYLYRDHRGGFHAVFHNMDPWPSTAAVGRHAFSPDGFQWYYSKNDAWSTTVDYEDGTSVDYARRERPEFIFDALGRITHLINGVVDSTVGEYGDRSFTVVQPVKQS